MIFLEINKKRRTGIPVYTSYPLALSSCALIALWLMQQQFYFLQGPNSSPSLQSNDILALFLLNVKSTAINEYDWYVHLKCAPPPFRYNVCCVESVSVVGQLEFPLSNHSPPIFFASASARTLLLCLV